MKYELAMESIRAYAAGLPRVVWFLVALGMVWAAAPHVQEFLTGFFDGAASAR